MKMIFMNFNSSCSCNVYSDVSKGFTSRMLFDRILGSMNILRLQFTPVVIKINSMNFRRTLLLILLSCLLTFPAMAQFDDEIPEEVLTFQTRLEPEDPRPGENVRLVLAFELHPGWHVYSIIPAEGEFPPIPSSMEIKSKNLEQVGPLFESRPVTAHDPVLDQVLSYHKEQGRLYQNLKVGDEFSAGSEMELSGNFIYQACSDKVCLPPKTENWTQQLILSEGSPRSEYAFPQYAVDELRVDQNSMEEALSGGFWSFLGLAVVAGLLALLTPCVFPMIPITVAFFSKQEESGANSTLRLSGLFGAGIVGTYTVTGMGLSAALGAAGAVQLATNGWVNMAIGLLFTVFAFSLMGFFQLQLPGSLGDRADHLSRKIGGPLGVIAMGFAFTLTSFTCTVQFVGTLMIAAAEGQWFWPLLGMLVFATVFAFPFFLLGLFPHLMSKFKSKSGDWMQQLKIILGLLELAAAFKFFSNTDLVWQWGILDRDFVLSTWAIICIISALFLLGSVTIHQTRVQHGGPVGFTAALAFLMLGLYFGRGLGGEALNPWVDTYLPPQLQASSQSPANPVERGMDVHSLPWLDRLDQALVQAKNENKRVFVDFTGYTCVNCRWMEKNVFSDPQVMALFRREFILVQLYTDGGENAESNQKLQIDRFQTVALPLYVVLDQDDRLLARHAGILEPAERFLRFLRLQDQG